MPDRAEFTSPIGGRLVSGDVYKGNTTDFQGNPLIIKSGPNAGQPKTNFYIGVAVPKTPNVPWESEPWGQIIVQTARQGVPTAFDPQTGQLYPGRKFAWKVVDGDSLIPNENQKIPAHQEGFPGHWVLNFSNGFAPKVCNNDGSAYITEPDAVKRGYYVQVLCNVGANNTSNPGVFLNHNIVSLSAYGEEIHVGVDASQAGFGQGTLPPGASTTPLAGMPTPTPPAQPTPPVQPVQQVQTPTPPVATQPAYTPPPPATDLVQPQQAYTPPPVVAEEHYIIEGQMYSRSQVLAFPGYTEAHLAGLQKVQ